MIGKAQPVESVKSEPGTPGNAALAKNRCDLKVAKSADLLAELYTLQGAYPQAEPLYLQEIAIIRQAKGIDEAMDLSRRHLLGFYETWGKHDKEPRGRAKTFIKKLIEWEVRRNDSNARTLLALAELYYVQGKPDRAEPWYEQAFEIWNDGDAHPLRAAEWMEHYAEVLEKTGKPDDAETFRHRAQQLRSGEARLTRTHG